MKGLLLGLLPIISVVFGQITIRVSDVEPLPIKSTSVVASADELFRQSCPEEVTNGLDTEEESDEDPVWPKKVTNANPDTPKLITSSYSDPAHEDKQDLPENIYPSSGSFIRGALVAWAQHQSLVLRPDVVWFEILAQLNFYMTKHADELRDLFVNFQGKEEIFVKRETWTDVIDAFAAEIQKRVKTEWLLGWILPGFSTSTRNDNMTATVLMMGLMQHYFAYSGESTCGLPSVTLLGTRHDWTQLLGKLDRLGEFGAGPAQYARKLKPILGRFVQTWDDPNGPEVKSFWSQIVRANQTSVCGVGPTNFKFSGWITGFIHWTEHGDPFPSLKDKVIDTVRLDDVEYHPMDIDLIPISYAKAPLKMLNYPKPMEETQAYVLAGNIGIKRTTSNRTTSNCTTSNCTVEGGNPQVYAEPLNSWFLYKPVDANFTTGPQYGNVSDVKAAIASLGDWCPAAYHGIS